MFQQAGGRAVEARHILAFDHGLQAGGQLLAEFDAPLVEGVDVPDRAFDEDAVLVKRDQPAERVAGRACGRARVIEGGCR